jgi:hypothetical protein
VLKPTIKKIAETLGYDLRRITIKIDIVSIRLALQEAGLTGLAAKLAAIVPDLVAQYSRNPEWDDFLEIKLRGMHAFQTTKMLKALRPFPSPKITVVDIGDSAGTHMLYLKEVCRGHLQVDTISVNLDLRAVEKIKARGLEAMLCRAEDLNLPGLEIDLFTSFEMVEHLHNPAIFFYRLAKRSSCPKILITVPYLKTSRVGVHHVRSLSPEVIFAEDEHIFELSPEDWTLLMLHSGWKVIHSEVYYQYPRKWPIISRILGYYWKTRDYEGFWVAILEKDLTFANRYQDWED